MSQRDVQLRAATREMATTVPYGWEWAVFHDRYGVVCAAWRELPEGVRLEARSAGELADEIAVYLDGLQAALEIACGQAGRLLDASHGAGSPEIA